LQPDQALSGFESTPASPVRGGRRGKEHAVTLLAENQSFIR